MKEVILAEVQLPTLNGILGMTCCPGKPDIDGKLNSCVAADLSQMKDWGADAVLSLISQEEMSLYQLPDLGEQISIYGMQWFHHPFEDGGIPDEQFIKKWQTQRERLQAIVQNGGKVIVHCRGGKGRTGLICAQLMLESGCDFEQTVALIREKRPGALAKQAHLDYLKTIPI